MNNQTWIIAQREYLHRIRSKGFIIATALGPLVMVAVFAVPVLAVVFVDDDTTRTIAVRDETGQLAAKLRFPESFEVIPTSLPDDSLRARVERSVLDGYLILPDSLVDGRGSARYFSRGGGGLVVNERIRSTVQAAVREHRIISAGAPETVLEVLRERVSVQMIKFTDDGEAADATPVLASLGYLMGFLIYICVILYGAIVMRGVIEEKVNRISELIASSAKPFSLMMGKVLGIGAMGLTQWIIWAVMGGVLSLGAGALIAHLVQSNAPATADVGQQAIAMDQIQQFVPDIPLSFPIWFILFFLGGYLLYASLMAAIGSAVQQESDAQYFMWLVIVPLIIPTILIFSIVSNPNTTMAVVMSLIPLFSPIVMVVRLAATNVPLWQSVGSFLILVGTFVLAIWVSSRIYRVGILSYGKRPTLRELMRWIRQP